MESLGLSAVEWVDDIINYNEKLCQNPNK